MDFRKVEPKVKKSLRVDKEVDDFVKMMVKRSKQYPITESYVYRWILWKGYIYYKNVVKEEE